MRKHHIILIFTNRKANNCILKVQTLKFGISLIKSMAAFPYKYFLFHLVGVKKEEKKKKERKENKH